jgi:hypothetical protein
MQDLIGNGVPKCYGFTPFFISAFVREATLQRHAYLHVFLNPNVVICFSSQEPCGKSGENSGVLFPHNA